MFSFLADARLFGCFAVRFFLAASFTVLLYNSTTMPRKKKPVKPRDPPKLKISYHPSELFETDINRLHIESVRQWYRELHQVTRVPSGMNNRHSLVTAIKVALDSIQSFGVEPHLLREGLTVEFINALSGNLLKNYMRVFTVAGESATTKDLIQRVEKYELLISSSNEDSVSEILLFCFISNYYIDFNVYNFFVFRYLLGL